MSLLRSLKFERSFIRKRITELNNEVTSNIADIAPLRKQTLISKFKKLESEVKGLNSKIAAAIHEESTVEESVYNKELKECESYDDKIIESIQRLENDLADINLSNTVEQTNSSLKIKLRAPQAPLPSFSGLESECIDKFFTDFEAVVNRYQYSDYEKFILLKSNLSGRPSILLKSLDASRQTHPKAKDLLLSALTSPYKRKFEVIKRLATLSFPYNKDPILFVSEVQILKDSFRNLEIDVDAIMQYFVWTSMNTTLQNQFVQITNSNHPTLKEIEENFFKAIERYQLAIEKFNEKKRAETKFRILKQLV